MDARINFLQKMAERMADEYSINWDTWQDDEAAIVTEQLDEHIKEYEARFFEIANGDEVSDEEYMEFNIILEELLSGYTLQTLLNRKKAIEDLLVSV